MKFNVRVAGDRLSFAVILTASVVVLVAGILLHLGAKVAMTAPVAAVQSSPLEQGTAPSRAGAGKRPGPQIKLAQLPLVFEANQGQTDARVKYLAHGGGYTLFLTQDEAVLKLSSAKQSAGSPQHSAAMRMKLVGASARAKVSGSDQLPSRSNYFLGNDPSKWRRNIPQFARIGYGQVYPGINLVYYGNQGRLEYDFEVAPGADPKQIAFEIQGADRLHTDSQGNLIAKTGAGDVQLHKPEIYQEIDGQRRQVAGKFVLTAGNRVAFGLGDYDRTRGLVIDPVLTFSTYFGGTGDEGCAFLSGSYTTPVSGCPAVAVDGAANWYVAGTTTSSGLSTNGTNLTGIANVFVAKFGSAGNLLFLSYLGGTGTDTPVGIGVDPSSQNVYVAGNTTSADFPVVNGIPTGTLSVGNHVFVTLFDKNLSAPTYSTYLAGDGSDTATGMANDSAGNAYVTGTTSSTNYPTTPGAYQTTNPDTLFSQIFVSKVATASSGSASLAYSTYFGASNAPASGAIVQGGGIAYAGGFVYITGSTNFLHTGAAGDFPILNAFQPCLDDPAASSSCPSTVSNTDAFVAKLNPTINAGGQLVYSSYLGGSGIEVAHGIAVDSNGAAYVTGSTTSTDFKLPTGITPFQPAAKGGGDAFVAKIEPAGNVLQYFSYLGGSGSDVGLGIAVDLDQAAHITGSTASADFLLVDAIPNTGAPASGSTSAFVALIQTMFSGTNGGYSSYLGGAGATGNGDGTGIATDLNANSYVVGETDSSGFPVTNSSVPLGGGDAFLAKMLPTATGLTITPTTSVASGSVAGVGNQVTFTYTIKNSGPGVASNVIFTDILPTSGATFASATSTPGSCTAAVNGTVSCSIGTLGGTTGTPGQAIVKINLTPTVAGALNNGGILQANGAPAGQSGTSVNVGDFNVALTPATAAVVAGNSATYQVSVGIPNGQTNFFPNSVSLSCSAGVPTGAACTFSTNPLTMTSTSAVSSTLTLTTTARPVTTGQLRNFRSLYAAILPITGITFLGFGLGATRRRRWIIGLFALAVFGLAGLQVACSSGSGTTTPPTGTPAGTYPITVTGTSGTVAHAVRMILVVQ